MWLTRLSVDRPIFIITVLLALFLFGAYGYSHMPKELNPRVELPIVNVTAVYAGAGPQQVEDRLTRPLEDAVATLPGIKQTDSVSMEGLASVTVTLQERVNPNAALSDVRSRVEAARRTLPSEVSAPVVARVDVDARPLMVLGVSFTRPQNDKDAEVVLREITDDAVRRVQPELTRVSGVANARVVGGREENVLIRVDPGKLEQNGLSLSDLVTPIKSSSATASVGALRSAQRQEPVRIVSQFTTLDQIAAVPVYPSQGAAGMSSLPPGLGGEGGGRGPAAPPSVLRLADVADVQLAPRAREEMVHVGGQPGVIIEVTALGGAAAVRVVDGIKRRIDLLQRRTPPGEEPLRIQVLQDESEGIRGALSDIHAAILLGCLFAILMVFLFLHNIKDTLIIGLQLPASIMATFGVMWAAGFTLNQMSMLGLALAIGILVDDSILVLDSIHRHREMGKPPRQAALDGRQEIGFADAMNSFLDVVIYVPVAAIAGVVGMYFRQFGLTVATASLFSLFVSFSFTPMLAARWFHPHERVERSGPGWAAAFDRRFRRLQSFYRQHLTWALRNRRLVVLVAFGSLAVALVLAVAGLRQEFVPPIDRGLLAVALETKPGLSLQATGDVMKRLEELVAASPVHPQIDEERTFARIGEIRESAPEEPARGPTYAELILSLRDRGNLLARLLRPLTGARLRTLSDVEIALRLRRLLAENFPAEAQRVVVSALRSSTGQQAPVAVRLLGQEGDQPLLARAAGEVQSAFSRLETPAGGSYLYAVDTSVRPGATELRVDVDRERAAELQVAPAEVVQVAHLALDGDTGLVFRQGIFDYPIRIAIDPSQMSQPSDLGGLIISQRGGSPVYLSDVASFRHDAAPVPLLRSDRRPMVRVTAEVGPGVDLGSAARVAQRAVNRAWAQPGSALRALGRDQIQWGGEVDSMASSFQDIAWMLVFSMALAYLLMAVLFNSFVYPLMIMVTVPIALVGAVLALLVTGTPLSLVAMIGAVLLLGLVAKNAILLVDFTNTLRFRDGQERNAAVIAAGPVRLRPILMTSLSTIFSALPVALSAGSASEIRAPMAIVTIGGLALASLLTLIVIPVVYTYADDAAEYLRERWIELAERYSGPGRMGPRGGPPSPGGNGRTQGTEPQPARREERVPR